eukprot:jgi/Mesvir1/4043/Mv16756-RA.1
MWRRGLRHGCRALGRSLERQGLGSSRIRHDGRGLHLGSASIREPCVYSLPKGHGNMSSAPFHRSACEGSVRRFASAQAKPQPAPQAKAPAAAASSPASSAAAGAPASAAKPAASGVPGWLLGGACLVAGGVGLVALFSPQTLAGLTSGAALGNRAGPTQQLPQPSALDNAQPNASAPADQAAPGPCIDRSVSAEANGQPASGPTAELDEKGTAQDAKTWQTAAKEEAAAAVATAMENAAALATAEAGAAAAEAEAALEQYMGAKTPVPASPESLDAPYLIARARMSRVSSGAGVPGSAAQGAADRSSHADESSDDSASPSSFASEATPRGYDESFVPAASGNGPVGAGTPGGGPTLWGGRAPAEVLVEAVQEAERRQAEADASLLAEKLLASEERHAGELAAVRRDAAARAQEVSQLHKKIAEQVAAHAAEMASLQSSLLSDKERSLKMQVGAGSKALTICRSGHARHRDYPGRARAGSTWCHVVWGVPPLHT